MGISNQIKAKSIPGVKRDSGYQAQQKWLVGLPVGDTHQDQVLIGVDMDEPAWRQRRDACLLTEAEGTA
ncbi:MULTISPECIES: hypothetical protein [Burkholderiaceae]|uniref:hypothetical protein n=1 Tax=Burkholderiaceae TaxID=119060 RepID=UPI00196482CB|nr:MULTISPECIES: hypothetical protein [Burkholderiaceae]